MSMERKDMYGRRDMLQATVANNELETWYALLKNRLAWPNVMLDGD